MRSLKMASLSLWVVAMSLSGLALTSAQATTPFKENSLVRQKCAVCHKLDQKGRVEVIEETRKSPEEWKHVVDRMIRLNGAPISDPEFNLVIKELSRHLILTPQEMSRVAYYNSEENSQYREIPADDVEKRIFTSCVRCHTYGKVRSHYMTREQWLETRLLHLGYYPTVVGQMRELDWPKESLELVDILAGRQAMDTPEWRNWMQNRKEQDLGGKWVIAGYQPGLGYYHGTYAFKANPGAGEDEYLIEKSIRYENGMVIKTAGSGTLYGEYHLLISLAPTALTGQVQGVFDLDAAANGFSGKWWTEVQDTNATGSEMFYKADSAPRAFAVFPASVPADGKKHSLTLVGANLPAALKTADISFHEAGLSVSGLKRVDSSLYTLEVTASAGAAQGPRKMSIKGADCREQVIVFSKLDAVRIYPPLARARVSSGAAYPAQGVQYVARGVSYGRDGKPDTPDDLILEPVEAKWWLEEHKDREKDDDLAVLQAPVVNGLYTPVTTYAPIETRFQRQTGIGLVYIGASCKVNGQEFKDRALLAVTVPDFIPQIK